MKKGIFRNSSKVAIVVVAAVVVGLATAASPNNLYNLGKNVEMLVNLFRSISLFYVDEVDSDELMEAAAKGMATVLDPYSEYLPAESMDDFTAMTSGKYGGVGSLIRLRGDYVEFSSPYEGSPADLAGIRPGDQIVEIAGKDAKCMTTQQVSELLRGDPGSHVRLKVKKFPTDEVVELDIARQRIAIPGIPYYGMVADKVGYIVHSDFTEGCSSDLLAAYQSLVGQGMEALVLDYRSNGGGILQEAVKILSMFLPKGTEVVSMRSTQHPQKNSSFKTQNPPVDTEIPIVVLINGSSASSAEIVAGALQDTDRAVLLGQRTFGKGLVQSTYPLGHNAYVKLTTNKYFLPSGRCIQAIDYSSARKGGQQQPGQVPDSLVTEYKTSLGRKVYDGGGVMPDVATEAEYASTFAYVVYGMGLVDDFVSDYCRNHYDQMDVVPTQYRFDDQAYQEFVDFMADKEVPWQSEALQRWKEFKKALEKERVPEDIAPQMAQIEENINISTADNLQLYKAELQEIIENQIVSRYCYGRGGIEHGLAGDHELQQAIELLQDSVRYNHLRTTQDTARK